MPATTPPASTAEISLDDVFRRRRTVRQFDATPPGISDVRRLLWAAQGVTGPDGRRTAPSPGALSALEVYAVTADGVWHYLPANDATAAGGHAGSRDELFAATSLDPAGVGGAVAIAIAGDVSRLEARFERELAARSMLLEAGHVAQNVLLEATALGLASVPLGLFDPAAVRAALDLPAAEVPIEIVAVGRPKV